MEHLALKATTISTEEELGKFEALVASWTADREKDTIDRHAFDQSISDWRASGKMLPLLHEHMSIVVGAIDPASMRTEERGWWSPAQSIGSRTRDSETGGRSRPASLPTRLASCREVTSSQRRRPRAARDRSA